MSEPTGCDITFGWHLTELLLLPSALLCCLLGPAGAIALATVFAVGVVVSTAGSNNGSIMTGGRAFYAVARGNQLLV